MKIEKPSIWKQIYAARRSYLEGAYMAVMTFPDKAKDGRWIERITELKDKYYLHILENNAFRILPNSMVHDSIGEWDDMSTYPKGELVYGDRWYVSHVVGAHAMDACFLAELTGDAKMERIAAGCMGWIFGANPGIPKWAARNPYGEESREVGALLSNLPDRHASAWTTWSFDLKNDLWLSQVNGFFVNGDDFEYRDIWQTAESFIKTDGTLAYAVCVYDNLLRSVG